MLTIVKIDLGRKAGQFSSPPFDLYHLSSLFLVPKSDNFRMILDLSYTKTIFLLTLTLTVL